MTDPALSRPRAGPLLAWLAVLSVASGLPSGIVKSAVPILYKDSKINLEAIGLLALVELPWTLKFLWAPALDRYASRKAWAVGCQVAIVLLLVALSRLPSDSVPPAAWAVLIGIAFASATQDVAVDGYAVAIAPAGLVGPVNGVRVSSWRIAYALGGGLLAGQVGALGWSGVWLLAAAAFVALAAATARIPAAPLARKASGPIYASVVALARRPGFAGFVVFVLLFKLGDYGMLRMAKPCLQDRGFTPQDVGNYVTPLEIAGLILGAMAGGAITKRIGVFRALWALGAAQALSCLAFAAAADHGRGALWTAVGIEAFGNGLGVAPFLSLLMLSCDREHAGSQFALLTAVMGLGSIAAGAASGFGVRHLGYPTYFAVCFALALPAFALLPSVRRWMESAPRVPAPAPTSA